MMKILLAHNSYQLPGGEDAAFLNEKALLLRHGHEVIEYVRHNDEIADYGLAQHVAQTARTVWNWDSYAQIKKLIRDHRPDVAHFHNTFPLISPAAYHACRDNHVPVIQTLHNSRLFCPAATLSYQNRYCQDCLGKAVQWPGIARACYRGSHLQTGLVSIMNVVHRNLGTWTRKVNRYIVFNSFFRQKFIQAGLPPERIVIKPHFIDDPGQGTPAGAYALYVGRLSESKGVLTLLRAWETLRHIPLVICGTGQLESLVEEAVSASGGNIRWLRQVSRQSVLDVMKDAAFVIWPSENVETFGLVALEAFACGKAVISSGVEPMRELVEPNITGIEFRAREPTDLAEKVAWAWSHKDEMTRMGATARGIYEAKYSAAANYKQLIDIYSHAKDEIAATTFASYTNTISAPSSPAPPKV